MGETWDWFAASGSSKVTEDDPERCGGFVVLGVGGAALVELDTLPMNHDGTQPRSPPSSLTA